MQTGGDLQTGRIVSRAVDLQAGTQTFHGGGERSLW
jgi:hypothetical protein